MLVLYNNFLTLYKQYFNSVYQSTSSIVVTGQFLHPAVMVDEGNQLLILPGRPSVPVVHKKLFAFIQAEAPEYKAKSCWTAKKRSNQGVGVIEGAYTDYEVSNLLSTGFNFGVANGEETV